ncbi:hypothetical protein DVH05_003836 [Phytophthora capsici]|nr:hypothetical protein DVH05_003836 [Phytophthora capsici]
MGLRFVVTALSPLHRIGLAAMTEKTTKRVHKDAPEADIIKALKTWQSHREQWGSMEASRKLGYPKGTLIGWRIKYSDRT